nr:putative 5-dehydro-4-deoxyglucarate regulator YcbG [uncultured bacterium]
MVREALKRLEALNLVAIRQGSGIVVQDLDMAGGMEITRLLLKREDNTVDRGFLNDLLDFREQIGQTIVRLAAENRTDEELARMKELLAERRLAFHDQKKLNDINSELLQLFAQATHNRVYQMVLNTLIRLLFELRAKYSIPTELILQVQRVLEQIVSAIEQRDGEVAGLLAGRHAILMRKQLEHLARAEDTETPPSQP